MSDNQQNAARRRSIRLRDYDYSQNGAYYITICTQNRRCLFGDIIGDEMILNDAGRMVAQQWTDLPQRFPSVEIDEHIIMPNHIHGIITIDREHEGEAEGRIQDSPLRRGGTLPETVGRILQAYKSLTTNDYTKAVKQHGWPPFVEKLWQRNYYEHVIRGEKELDALREYIYNNPLQWALDEENPDHQP